MRIEWVLAVTAAWCVAGHGTGAAPAPAFCDQVKCVAGSKVVLVKIKGTPFYVCPTLALTDYTNTVLGLVAISGTLGGQLPDISPETGEPAYQGESASMLAELRAKAKVRTFDEALSLCANGRAVSGLTVMNNADEQ